MNLDLQETVGSPVMPVNQEASDIKDHQVHLEVSERKALLDLVVCLDPKELPEQWVHRELLAVLE